MMNSSPALPISLADLSTQDESYPQAVNSGGKALRLPGWWWTPWSQAVGKKDAAA